MMIGIVTSATLAKAAVMSIIQTVVLGGAVFAAGVYAGDKELVTWHNLTNLGDSAADATRSGFNTIRAKSEPGDEQLPNTPMKLD